MQKQAKATKPTLQSHSDAHLPPREVRVWDPLVRVFHWTLVACFVTAWLTANRFEDLHSTIGYTVAVLLGLRIIWGFVGAPHARFTDFVTSPARVLRYLRDIALGKEARYLGHNPAGGAMVLALIVALGGLIFTGWLMYTDTYYGDDRVAELHGLIAHGVLGLIGLHLIGVLVASLRHRENLPRAMITGTKRPPDTHDSADSPS